METTPRKGMSKGCMIGLIIGVAVIVVILMIGIMLYVFWGPVTKFGTTTTTREFKALVATTPPEGLDTVQFNALADAFIDRIDQDEAKEWQPLAIITEQLYKATGDKIVTREEAMTAAAAMINQYPELEQYWITEIEAEPEPTAEPESEEVTAPVQDSVDGE